MGLLPPLCGWHNYHHAFPWDYRTAELGTPFNFTANVIDFCIKMGWVFDPKAATEESVFQKIRFEVGFLGEYEPEKRRMSGNSGAQEKHFSSVLR
uniref:Fatty acid desaturase domain-containing protein n=1 Tax=Lutzomyia longipalpis TaxID=7200 RepID=A0A1B0GL68_LUTLO